MRVANLFRYGLSSILLALVLQAWAQPGEPALPLRCDAPAELAQVNRPLARTAAELTTGSLVRIAVLGSGSSAGNGVSVPEHAYPAMLKASLQRLFPDAAFEVSTFARRGARVADMLERLQAEVLPRQPVLVIWQIGVSDVVETVPLNGFRRDLERGVKLVRAAGADLVLVDMQYSRYTALLVSPGEYLDQLRWLGRRQGIALLRRYAMMERWAGSNAFDFDARTQDEQQRVADRVHGCVAAWLAQMIHQGVLMANKR